MSPKKPNDLEQTAQTPEVRVSDNMPINTDKRTSSQDIETVPDIQKPVLNENMSSQDSTTEDMADEITMLPTEPVPSSSGWSPKKKTFFNLGLFIVLIIIGVLLVLYAWKLPPFTPTVQHTNNAFVKGQTTIISSRVSGYVTDVAVQDFQNVQAGEVLVKIDDRSFQQQLEQARANIDVAVTNRASNAQDTQSSQAQIEAREADLYSAKISVDSAQEDVKRYQGLDAIGAVSKAEVSHTKAQLAKAQAAVQQAEANLQAARQASKKTSGNRTSLDANIKNAEAGAKQAQISLDDAVITAPESGQLSQVSVQTGQYVSAGTQLMYIVPKGVWIIANFKETQVENMSIGEPAIIRVDALGGAKFTGHIDNISPATGSEFSAGAANPTTGNYIKIAQRIPVRITLDKGQPELAKLRPGMSVSVDIETAAR